MGTSRGEALRLYKTLMRTGQGFANYNFRCYVQRKIRDSFKENKMVTDPVIVEGLLQNAKSSLQLIKRQATISQMFAVKKIVIEDNFGSSIK